MNPDLATNVLAPIISTQALTKRYNNNFVVNQVNLSVMPGDVFGLLGPNGAGKTTIIRMLLGLVRPSSGRAILFGADIATGRKFILGKTSAIVEAPSLYPHLSGMDNMKVMAYSAGVTDIEKMRRALSQMGMLERAKDRFQTYSLGMKQRLCIAAALLTDPQLIILDEPTNGLDPAGIQSIRELIKHLAGQGRTVFLSSHLLNEVQQVCNRVAIIERGTIIAQGLVEEMLASHNFIQLRVPPDEFGRAVKVLQELEIGRSAHLFGEYLVVDGAANRGGEINRVLGQAGIYPSEIIPRHLSLEEFFLSVTNRPPMPPPGYPNQPPPGYTNQPAFGYSSQPPPPYPPQTFTPPPGYPYHTPMPPQVNSTQPPGRPPGYPTQPLTLPGYSNQPPQPAGHFRRETRRCATREAQAMLNLLRAEILKQGRLTTVLLVAISPAILTWVVLGALIIIKLGGADFGNVPANGGSPTIDIGSGTFGLSANILLVSMGGLYLIGLVIVGGMVGSNEFGWHTIKMLATREPSRTRIILSKCLFLGTLAAFMAVILVLGWLLLGVAFKVLYNTDQAGNSGGVDLNALGNGLRYLLCVFLVYLTWSFLTMFLAVRFKSVVVAIIIYFVINTLDGIVSSLGQLAIAGQLGTRFPGWLEPLINLAKIISPFLVNFSLNQLTANPQNPTLIKNVPPVQSVLVLLVWAGLFIWAGVSVFNKRDITE